MKKVMGLFCILQDYRKGDFMCCMYNKRGMNQDDVVGMVTRLWAG